MLDDVIAEPDLVLFSDEEQGRNTVDHGWQGLGFPVFQLDQGLSAFTDPTPVDTDTVELGRQTVFRDEIDHLVAVGAKPAVVQNIQRRRSVLYKSGRNCYGFTYAI
jgi:hypothetical protein